MYNKGNSNSATTATSTTTSSAATATSSTSTNSSNNNNNGSNGGSNDRIEWSRATILGFIEDYRRQRVLWDPNTKGYHIKQTKYEALKALGQKYGAEIRSIRSKIKSLRSSFHREHGKVINGRRKGLNYQPMWFAYDAIRFILDGETGDSDEAEGGGGGGGSAVKNDTLDSTSDSHILNNNSLGLMGWSGIGGSGGHMTDEEMLEERKISSRDIEHFNNHFLALGLQARHPMAMLAAVEAAAAASALSAVAQEKRQEQDYALLKQQQQQQKQKSSDNDDDNKHDDSSQPPQLKIIELSTINNNNNAATATLNPISKPFASPKPSSPLAVAPTTTATSSTTPPPPPPQSLQTPPSQSQVPPHQQLPSSTTTAAANTCSPEKYNVLHGSRSLDENSALASTGNNASATAISSLPITSVVSNSQLPDSRSKYSS